MRKGGLSGSQFRRFKSLVPTSSQPKCWFWLHHKVDFTTHARGRDHTLKHEPRETGREPVLSFATAVS